MTLAHPFTTVAVNAVLNSGRVARSVQADLDRVREVTKDDRSPVTVADFAVQAIVALELLEHDPETRIVGEERADLLRQPEQAVVRDAVIAAVRTVRSDVSADAVLDAIDHCDHDGTAAQYWALDPVDGTKGFLRGQQYAIALAWIERGTVELGVLGCPNLPVNDTAPLDVADRKGSVYVAARGDGTWSVDPENAAAMSRVTCAVATEGMPIRVCESVEAAHSRQSDSARIADELGGRGEPARLDSQCKYAVVARGQADAYLRLPTMKGYVEKIWDHAAGSLVATEAGAVVSDITGTPLDFGHGRQLEMNRGVICAVAGLHERIIETIDRLQIGVAV